jgi:hypothetical protein
MKTAPLIAMVIGGLILLWPSGGVGPGPAPGPNDDSPAVVVLSQCFAAEQAAKLDLLRQMSGMTWPGSTPGERSIPASDWWLEKSNAVRIEAQIPFTDALAEAINSETLEQFAGVK